MDVILDFVGTLPIVLIVAIYVVCFAILIRFACEILYSAVLAGIQMFPWVRERWGKPGITILILCWVFFAPVMIATCLLMGVALGAVLLLRSQRSTRELDDLVLRLQLRKASEP